MRHIASIVGGSFGMVFVLVNADTPFGPAFDTALRVLAAAAFVALLVLVVIATRGADAAEAGGASPFHFGRGFAIVVAIEVVLLAAGIGGLPALGAPPEANVAWIACVVGLHFVPLGWLWGDTSLYGLAATLTVLGLAGFLLILLGAPQWTLLVSGVLSGVVLLGGAMIAPAIDLRGRTRAVVS